MIIVKLYGGIGNQMFQYAAGRALSLRNDTELKLDISAYKYYENREYKLSRFNIRESFATNKDIYRFIPRRRHLIRFALSKIREKTCPWYKQELIREPSLAYNQDILKVRGDVYIDGYWQSEKYFKDISDILRSEFTLKEKPDEINFRMIEKMQAVNSVSLHIRRGDYLSNPDNYRIHGVLSMDYYMQSVELIAESVDKPEIFIFSDDIEWVKNNLKIPVPCHFAEYNGPGKDHEDLRLISMCKNHIIANSSFSWWGAWLCRNPGKIVIAPKKWFNTGMKGPDHIIPDSWLKI